MPELEERPRTYRTLDEQTDQGKLSGDAVRGIESNAGNLFVSAITAFEISLKCRKGKLDLPLASGDWYRKALSLHGLNEIPISGACAARAAALPDIHGDPCDRFIVAGALEDGLKIVTPDTVIPTYPGVAVVW